MWMVAGLACLTLTVKSLTSAVAQTMVNGTFIKTALVSVMLASVSKVTTKVVGHLISFRSETDREVVDQRSGSDDGQRDIYQNGIGKRNAGERFKSNDEGRWPPNIILTHSPDCTDDDCADDCPVAEMNRQSGDTKSVKRSPTDKDSRGIPNDSNMVMRRQDTVERGFADTGGASRFFPCFRYNAKAPKKERPIVEGLPGHPTVKPVALMQWLVKLVTPPNGVVLDPFAGTGTTAEACLKEGLYCILIERDPDSIRRIDARLDKYNSTKEAA